MIMLITATSNSDLKVDNEMLLKPRTPELASQTSN